MRVLIFGTGKVYDQQKKYIQDICEIEAFLDNNEKLWSKEKDGIAIYPPRDYNKFQFDFIVLMSIYSSEMKHQLIGMHCSEDKILHYEEFLHLFYNCNVFQYGTDVKKKEEACIVISNSIRRYGGTTAAIQLAKTIKKLGSEVVIVAENGDDEIISEMVEQGLTIFLYKNINLSKWNELPWIQNFGHYFVNTFSMIMIALELSKHVHVNMWIHESEVTYNTMTYWKESILANYNDSRLHVYAVSAIARDNYRRFIGTDDNVWILECCVDDNFDKYDSTKEKEKLVIAVIGSMYAVKGQDILCDVYSNMSIEQQQSFKIELVGSATDSSYYDDLKKKYTFFDNIKFISEMCKNKLDEYYRGIDIIVTPSRQDTLSLVTVEGLMRGKICIVSSKAGIANYIIHGKNGFVFDIEEPEQLKDILLWCKDHQGQLADIRINARKTYLEIFSKERFAQQIVNILQSDKR